MARQKPSTVNPQPSLRLNPSGLQAFPKGSELVDLTIDSLQVRRAQRRDACARHAPAAAEGENLFDVVEGKPQLLGPLDKTQFAQDLIRVDAIAGRGTRRGRDELLGLVEPNRVRGNPRPPRDFPMSMAQSTSA